MDFRKETRGENATKNVELVISFYDNGVAKDKDDPDKIAAHYGETWGHPDAEVSQGQTNLALVTQRVDRGGKVTFNHSVPFYPGQLEAIKEAAGDNTAPLLDRDGVRRGTVYGVRADLMSVQREGKTIGFMPNTKSLQASELSVADKDGKPIRTRIFEAMAEAKAANEKSAPEAEVQVEEPAKPKAKSTRSRKPAAAKEAATVEAEAELV